MAKVVSLLPEFLDQSGDPDPEPQPNSNGGPTTFNAVIVSGAGSPLINGTYTIIGTTNGKPSYSDPTEVSNVFMFWDETRWVIKEGIDDYYESFEDVATPDLVVAWSAVDFGSPPAPTVTPTNV
jgi:hypothetical protein